MSDLYDNNANSVTAHEFSEHMRKALCHPTEVQLIGEIRAASFNSAYADGITVIDVRKEDVQQVLRTVPQKGTHPVSDMDLNPFHQKH